MVLNDKRNKKKSLFLKFNITRLKTSRCLTFISSRLISYEIKNKHLIIGSDFWYSLIGIEMVSHLKTVKVPLAEHNIRISKYELGRIDPQGILQQT